MRRTSIVTPARAATWFPQPYHTETNRLAMTAANAALSVARLLRGDISACGAFELVDADTLDEAYLAEVHSLMPEQPAGVPLVDKSIEFLDSFH